MSLMKILNFLFPTALVVFGSLEVASGHIDQEDQSHIHHKDNSEVESVVGHQEIWRDEHGLIDDGSEILRQGTLIWPVHEIHERMPVRYLSFVDPPWDGIEDHTYSSHTGMDIGYTNMRDNNTHFKASKQAGYFGEVIAAAGGNVVAFETDQGDFCFKALNKNFLDEAGNYVVRDHDPDGSLDLVNLVGYRYTSYWHLQTDSNSHLKMHEFVEQGAKIGDIGSSGNSEGPHLHFEVLKEFSTPEDMYFNEDHEAQTADRNDAYFSAIVDPFYSWKGGPTVAV